MLLLSRFIISGHSMEPTIKNGESILVSSIPFLFSKPKIGDIVAFLEKDSRKVFIKRIIKMNKNKYFLTGDNKKDSKDSRVFGWIGRREIVGKVVPWIS